MPGQIEVLREQGLRSSSSMRSRKVSVMRLRTARTRASFGRARARIQANARPRTVTIARSARACSLWPILIRWPWGHLAASPCLLRQTGWKERLAERARHARSLPARSAAPCGHRRDNRPARDRAKPLPAPAELVHIHQGGTARRSWHASSIGGNGPKIGTCDNITGRVRALHYRRQHCSSREIHQ